jgi:long-chain acyl-CoA synthetase
MGYMAGFLNTVLCPLLAGGSIVISQKFGAQSGMTFWDLVLKKSTNSIWLTPTMVAYLVRISRNKDIEQKVEGIVQNIFVGTAPLLSNVRKSFEEKFGITCLESYGTSETMLTSSNSFLFDKNVSGTGVLLEGVEIEVRDDAGKVLSKGEEGNIFIKSPYLLKGYLGLQNTSLISPLKSGFFDTGDYGYQDHNNYLFITSRTKDLIIRGGVNISPRYIEDILLKNRMIREVAIIGKAHPFWGEEIVAFVVLEDSANFDMESIIEYCKENITNDSIPTIIKVVNELPYSSTGKVQKNKLKDLV